MTLWLDLFTLYPWLFLLLTGLTGLILGSFLNVVIHRLPIMMEREWRAECSEFLAEDGSATAPSPARAVPAQEEEPRYNLLVPGSACPHCKTAIPAWRNIPLLSYLLQKGRCHHCDKPISARYPLVELATGVVTLGLAWLLGPTPEFLAAWVLTLGLIALAAIDMDTLLLPDQITLPLLWLGLLVNLSGLFVPLEDAVIGAAAGYLSLWIIFQGFKLLTGKEGMGYGDFKLLALFGAWFGWQCLLTVMLIASFGGALFGITMIVSGKLNRENPMPFGPWIAFGGFVYLCFGQQLVAWYLTRMVGL
ncbi:A24 family peptidase [Ferrimonas gelatinilytica]|uniref:Prepilin leader peptidase/N-methyltransferase n=1 Tax=Ferrimonas gelatinilytica TaxID=1255257 RepID=A0ABP9SF63_9GAMM